MTAYPALGRLNPRGWPDGVTPGFIEVGADPTSGVGFQAPIGSIAKYSTSYYEKVDSTATGWSLIPAAGTSWAARAERRAVTACGLSVGAYTVVHEPFTTPGTTSTDFGQSWTVTVGAGARIAHDGPAGAYWRGGVATIQQTSGAWTTNQLAWNGPGLLLDGAADKGAIVIRLRRYLAPAANAFNACGFGWQDAGATKAVYLGYDESIDATHLFLGLTGSQVITSLPITALDAAAGVEAIIAQTGRLMKLFVNGTLYASAATDGSYTNLSPWLYANKGIFAIDDVLVVVDGAFPA